MYYILDSEFPMLDDTTYYDIDDSLEIEGIKSWALGISFTVVPPNPILVPITRIGESLEATLIPIPFNDANMCLASPEIAAVLDRYPENVALYDALLVDIDTQEKYPYFALNITSFLSKDLINGHGDGQSLHIARLAENKSTIVVSAQLKNELEHFQYLKFKSMLY